ncbi:WhiB family transcriptional regulator [Cellulomonas sp. URHB0016]
MTDDQRRADKAELEAYLRGLDDNGLRIPCRLGPADTTACWTSDDPAQQEYAARRCVPCQAVAECRAYGLAHRDEVGVYGGLTDAERHPKVGRPKKGEAA